MSHISCRMWAGRVRIYDTQCDYEELSYTELGSLIQNTHECANMQ